MMVEGASMEPAYPSGTTVLIHHLAYLLFSPARGDVVVMQSPEVADRVELKRIIGLPDEMVSWSTGRFQINGIPLDEPYARIAEAPPGDDEKRRCQLGACDYFVAGDHRLYSRDSRHYGPIARSMIIGKVAPCR
ncbi:MAG: signal peptidase I [Candidatus Omnitrophica bacterium]|nr:signal peptidase I [Candidatus Omnitrophota bacterium]